MKKTVIALLASVASVAAVAQTHSFEASLASARKSPVSVVLLRASVACGPLIDCSYRDSDRKVLGIRTDPCVSTPFACQMSSSNFELKSSGYFGGAKLSTDVGNMSLTFGRHRDNLVLAQATFVEGTYRLGAGSLAVGVLQGPRLVDSAHSRGLMTYVNYRMSF